MYMVLKTNIIGNMVEISYVVLQVLIFLPVFLSVPFFIYLGIQLKVILGTPSIQPL